MAEEQGQSRIRRWAWWIALAAALLIGMALGWFFREMYLRRGEIRLPQLGLSSIVLLGTIALLVPLAWLMRSGERRDLLQKCLLLSLLVHVVLAMSFSAMQVSREILQYVREEIGMEIPVNLQAARMAELQLQLRHQITELPATEQVLLHRPAEPAMQMPSDLAPPAPMQFSAPVNRPGAMTLSAPGPRIPVPQRIAPLDVVVPQVAVRVPAVRLPEVQAIAAAIPEAIESPRPESRSLPHAMTDIAAPPVNAGPVPVRPSDVPTLAPPLPVRPDLTGDVPLIRPSINVMLGPLDLPAPVRISPVAPVADAGLAGDVPVSMPRQTTGVVEGPPTLTPVPGHALPPAPQSLAEAPPLSSHVPDAVASIAPSVPMPLLDLPRPALPLAVGIPAATDVPPIPARPADLLRARPPDPRPHERLAPSEIRIDDESITDRARSGIHEHVRSTVPDSISAAAEPLARLSPLRTATLASLPTEESLAQRGPEQRQPLVETFGGTAQTEQAVARSLAYLARSQQPDGRWTRYGDDRSPRVRREQRHDIGITGLAALAFLAGDHTHVKPGPYRETVARALAYLHDAQQRNGDTRGADGDLYSQAIATIALAEAAIMTGDDQYRQTAHRAADFIIASRNRASGAWRYVPFESGDMSVTGWQIMALHSAKQAGYELPGHVVRDALRWIDELNAGRHGGLSRYRDGEEPTAAMTAQALFSRILFGQRPGDAAVREASDFVTKNLPPAILHDYYQYYCISLMLMQLQNDAWEKWNPAVRDQLLKLQRRGGDADGSFDPDDRWSDRGGRVYSTAVATLTLQVYYRYLPMYGRQPAN